MDTSIEVDPIVNNQQVSLVVVAVVACSCYLPSYSVAAAITAHKLYSPL